MNNDFEEYKGLSDEFESFIQVILSDYDSGVIDRSQATLAFQNTFLLLQDGNVNAVSEWIKTGHKTIRRLGNAPIGICDEFWKR